MNQFKGKRGEALSMALIVVAMTLVTDLENPNVMDAVTFALILLALGRIIWIFPNEG